MLRALVLVVFLVLAPSAIAQEWSVAPDVQDQSIPPPALPEGWTTVRGTFLRIHGPEHRTELLLRLSRHGSAAIPRLAETLQVPIGNTIHVYVADTDARFKALQPGRPPLWADATAWPGSGLVFLRDPRLRGGDLEPIEQVFDHELVHILLGRAFAPERPPSWLQEGAAQVLAGQAGPDVARELSQAHLRGGIVSLLTLERGFPRDALRAQLAYAEAADFVQYLQAEHGDGVLPRLVQASAGGQTLAAAVRTTTGQSLEEVEDAWSSRWKQSAALTVGPLAQLDGWLMGLGGVMLLIGGVLRRRRFHRRLAQMEADELLVDSLAEQLRRSG